MPKEILILPSLQNLWEEKQIWQTVWGLLGPGTVSLQMSTRFLTSDHPTSSYKVIYAIYSISTMTGWNQENLENVNSEGKNLVVQPHGANLKQPRCKSKRRKWEFGDLHEGRRAERLLDQENSFGKGFYCTFVQLERFSWQIVLSRVLEGALVVRTSYEENSTSLHERGLLFVFEGSFLYKVRRIVLIQESL